MSCSWIQDQGNCLRVLIGMSQVNANYWSVRPFQLCFDCSLQRCFKNKNWTSKRVLMFVENIILHIGISELGNGSGSPCFFAHIVANEGGMFESIGPQMSIGSFRTPVRGMEKHGSCMLSQISNSSLNFAILMMCSNTTEGNGLTTGFNIFLECCVCESPIVCMVMLDGHI